MPDDCQSESQHARPSYLKFASQLASSAIHLEWHARVERERERERESEREREDNSFENGLFTGSHLAEKTKRVAPSDDLIASWCITSFQE